MPSDYCAQDVCKYEETWSVVPNSCTPNPHVCDQTNHLGYLKGIQTETKSLIEQCKYCGPCPPSITRDTDCEIPSEYCECDGEWSPYTPSCDSFPCGETHIQTRTFELAPGFVPDRSLLCPSPEERQCPVSPCPVVDNPVYTYNGVEYTVFPYEQTLNACSEVGLFEVQDSETCLNISRQHYAADNYQNPEQALLWRNGDSDATNIEIGCSMAKNFHHSNNPRTVHYQIPLDQPENFNATVNNSKVCANSISVPPEEDTNPIVTPPPEEDTNPIVTPPPEQDTNPIVTPPPEQDTNPIVTPPPEQDTNPVYTYNGVEYTVFPYEQTLNACSEVGLFEVQDSETCLNISRQHYAADNYQNPEQALL